MSKRPTPETDAVAAYEGNWDTKALRMTAHARKLERKRDEAREALADWENAAAHVEADHPDEKHCGCVPVLRKLLADSKRERDEAREDAAHWKIEYEIVVARLRGEKHPNDNGIVAPDEIIPKLTRKLDEARGRAKELSELVDGAYILVELDKPQSEYNKKWREAWLEKAKRLIPGVDSIWY